MGLSEDMLSGDIYTALDGTRQLRFYIGNLDTEKDPVNVYYEAIGVLLQSTPEFVRNQKGPPNYGKLN